MNFGISFEIRNSFCSVCILNFNRMQPPVLKYTKIPIEFKEKLESYWAKSKTLQAQTISVEKILKDTCDSRITMVVSRFV